MASERFPRHVVAERPSSRPTELRLWVAPTWPSVPGPRSGRCVEWCGRRLEPSSYALLGVHSASPASTDGLEGAPFWDALANEQDDVRYGFETAQLSAVQDWFRIWGVAPSSIVGAHGRVSSSEVAFAYAATFLARTDVDVWEAPDEVIISAWHDAERLVNMHYRYASSYRRALRELDQPLAPEHKTVDPALASLPGALRTLYHVAGRHPLNSIHNRLLDPRDLAVKEGKITFLEENQMSVVWAIDADSADDDPVVWQGQHDGAGEFTWYAEDSRLSRFVPEMWAWILSEQ